MSAFVITALVLAFGVSCYVMGLLDGRKVDTMAKQAAKVGKASYARWYAAAAADKAAEDAAVVERQRKARAPMNLLPSDYRP